MTSRTLLCTFVFMSLLLLPVVAHGQANPEVGVVSTLRGSADALRQGQAPVTLNQNDSVFRKDVLITRAQSWLEVALDDGSTFTMAENSRVEIEEFVPGSEPQGLLSLIRGKLRSTISAAFSSRRDSYKVQTKEGVMGVQGTEFDVLALPLESQLYVYSGVVSVTHRDPAFPGTQLVRAGQTVTITAGQPVPQPTNFLVDTVDEGLGSGGTQDLLSGGRQMDDPTVAVPGIPDITDSGSRVPPDPNPPGEK